MYKNIKFNITYNANSHRKMCIIVMIKERRNKCLKILSHETQTSYTQTNTRPAGVSTINPRKNLNAEKAANTLPSLKDYRFT